MATYLDFSDPAILDPERPKPRYRPLEAMRRMKRLIADKEDTEQVFHIIRALNGDHLLCELDRFAQSDSGARRIRERRSLPAILDDHGGLGDLPQDSVGAAYIRFMKQEGLTAQGLVDESNTVFPDTSDDLVGWYGNRKRDTHDMFHVLSGYGRDALGEAALLGFTHAQAGGGFGVLFIGYMGTRQIRKSMPRNLDVMACFHEGRRNGEAAKNIIEQDILELLPRPLEDVRKDLGIRPPETYLRVLAEIDRMGNAAELLAAA